MALHFQLQLHVFFLLVFIAIHASSCDEQEEFWKMKLPKVPMPQAIKDSLLHSHAIEPFTIDSKEKKANMNQPYTVFTWKYDADNKKEMAKDEVVEPIIIDTNNKEANVKQPYTVFSWKYDADNTKEKASDEIIDMSNKKASVKQPYTVMSWKYDANNKEKGKDGVVEPIIIDTNKKEANVKQPFTVFSWKYDADNTKEKTMEVVKKAQINQPYTVFSWKYNNEKDSQKISIPKQSHHQHFMHNNHANSKDVQQEEDLSSGSVFFVEKSLRLGSTLKHDFQKTPEIPFLPKEIVQSFPFSVDKYEEILNLLSVKPKSDEATAIKETLGVCLQRPKVKKENRTCAQSMEDIVEFVVRELGTNDLELRMMKNNIEVPEGIQDYVITKVKKLVVPGNTAAACHRMSYPYVVYYCHHQQDIGHYDVTLVSLTSGTAFQTTAVCHYDTYAWKADVPALQYLRIRPGDAPVCHFSAINDMFWSLKADYKSLDMAQ